jgi:hypothetical protein
MRLACEVGSTPGSFVAIRAATSTSLSPPLPKPLFIILLLYFERRSKFVLRARLPSIIVRL